MKPLESLIPRIRPDVTDSLDTTTQLETLGYNRSRVWRDFKLHNTFELGRALFKIMPKRSFIPALQTASMPYFRQFFLFMGISLTSLFQPTLWPLGIMLVWGLVCYYLLRQAEKKTLTRLFTLAFIVGLLLIIACNLFISLTLNTIALMLFWWNLALSLWRQPKTYWLIALLLLGALIAVSPQIAIIGLLLFSLLFIPTLQLPKASTLNFIKGNTWGFALRLLFALALAYLLWHLQQHSPQPWIGLILIAAIFFLFEWFERSLIQVLRTLIWQSTNREDYHSRLFSSLGFLGQIMLLLGFIAVILSLKFLNLVDFPIFDVALLALNLGLSLFLLRLEQVALVATGFALAALLVFLGFHFWLVMLGLILIFLTGMMLLIMRVEGPVSSIL